MSKKPLRNRFGFGELPHVNWVRRLARADSENFISCIFELESAAFFPHSLHPNHFSRSVVAFLRSPAPVFLFDSRGVRIAPTRRCATSCAPAHDQPVSWTFPGLPKLTKVMDTSVDNGPQSVREAGRGRLALCCNSKPSYLTFAANLARDDIPNLGGLLRRFCNCQVSQGR